MTMGRFESSKHDPHHATLVKREDAFHKAGV